MKVNNDKDIKFIDVEEMNLDEWLNLVFSSKNEEYIFIDYAFPNNFVRDEYLETIHERDEKEVINLLRKFLIQSGTSMQDKFNLRYLLECKKNDKAQFNKLINIEYYKRVAMNAIDKNYSVWEGNTWIIDLLPRHPKLAINAIEAYFIAHIQFLPDGRFSSFSDIKSIIRSKFIFHRHPDKILLSLNPYDFEYLISALYRKMDYETKVTKKSGDGGIDIEIKKELIGKKEESKVSCKRYIGKVSIEEVRDLYGGVSSEKANKGILVATSDFSKPAKDFASKNHIELINGIDLNKLLNEYFGTNWQLHLDYIIQNEKDENNNLKHSPDKILFSIDTDNFKYLISALYRRMGYKTEEDINFENIIIKNLDGETKLLISCDNSQKNMGINKIKKLKKRIENEKVGNGVFITISDFTPQARKYALGHNIKLINIGDLYKILNKWFGTKWLSDFEIIINKEKEKIKKQQSNLK